MVYRYRQITIRCSVFVATRRLLGIKTGLLALIDITS